jgi:hypothetical protein
MQTQDCAQDCVPLSRRPTLACLLASNDNAKQEVLYSLLSNLAANADGRDWVLRTRRPRNRKQASGEESDGQSRSGKRKYKQEGMKNSQPKRKKPSVEAVLPTASIRRESVSTSPPASSEVQLPQPAVAPLETETWPHGHLQLRNESPAPDILSDIIRMSARLEYFPISAQPNLSYETLTGDQQQPSLELGGELYNNNSYVQTTSDQLSTTYTESPTLLPENVESPPHCLADDYSWPTTTSTDSSYNSYYNDPYYSYPHHSSSDYESSPCETPPPPRRDGSR